ncbi:MAG: alanine dehydrogenase [Actinobacteria bacterium]|jgi:alanine dehydrogenase|nr:alanine dehydrogenase [Actinomycetota bacterium]
MRIGVPAELKDMEARIAITPSGTRELVAHGHEVLVERGAGLGSSLDDESFRAAGAEIVPNPDELWERSDLVLKVKEPVPSEYHRLREGLVLFTYLHLAASLECTNVLLDSGITSIAYETVGLPGGTLPLLAPMSEVAGRMAPQEGARCLEKEMGGRGILLGGAPGVHPGKVVVLGAGVAGMNATAIAVGMQARVQLLDTNVDKLRVADHIYRGQIETIASNAYEIERACLDADLVIGSVLIPGARAPKLVTDDLVNRMKPGSALVDISIDQGGCFESSRPTTHSNPTFTVGGSIFYCVANMPGAVSHTSTFALTNVTMPYVVSMADHGWKDACRRDGALARGLATHRGDLLSEPVSEAHNLPCTGIQEVL